MLNSMTYLYAGTGIELDQAKYVAKLSISRQNIVCYSVVMANSRDWTYIRRKPPHVFQ